MNSLQSSILVLLNKSNDNTNNNYSNYSNIMPSDDLFVAIETTPFLAREVGPTTSWTSKAKIIVLTLVVLGTIFWLTVEMAGSKGRVPALEAAVLGKASNNFFYEQTGR